MTPQYVISELLKSETKYPQNLELLKKVILVAYLGRLQINGQSPDNNITLGDYLFDEERMIFDYTRLSDEKKNVLLEWLIGPFPDKTENFLNNSAVNEYRGFTAEVNLSLWGRIKHWLKNRPSQYWKIDDLILSLNYQLIGIDMRHGLNGTLVGFNQYLAPPTGAKYKNPDDPQSHPLGNTKRVFLTDHIVNQLIHVDINAVNFDPICTQPHPFSIQVNDRVKRFKDMQEYRTVQKYIILKPWYIRVIRWLIALLMDEQNAQAELHSPRPVDTKRELIFEQDGIKMYQNSKTKHITVVEKKSDIENLVFCGGGPKVFGHVGVWKALNEAKIQPKKFAGSSAGAIMAFFCYLGYSADEINHLFKEFKKENLIRYDIDWNGLAESHSLKTALDYAAAKKVLEITNKYGIEYPSGKITFEILDNIRQQCPGCGIGDELIVTTTHKRLREKRLFSKRITPDAEATLAVTASASLPVILKPTLIDGDEHNDGGVLNNFPTEAFTDDLSTFLESEYGNNLKTLAVQFDNGTERHTIDRIMQRVYKENFIINWIYTLITGVKDPASAWEQDRMKLRKYANQTIIVKVGDTSSSAMYIDDAKRNELIANGYQGAQDYIKIRYSDSKGTLKNAEYMYATFKSLGELLTYCCYRGDLVRFNAVHKLIANDMSKNKDMLLHQASILRKLYFNQPDLIKNEVDLTNEALVMFGPSLNPDAPTINLQKHRLLVALYPVFVKLAPLKQLNLVKLSSDEDLLERGRHALKNDAPFESLSYFEKIKGPRHIVLQLIINVLCEFRDTPDDNLFVILQHIQKLDFSQQKFNHPVFYSCWNITTLQGKRWLKLVNDNDFDAATKLCSCLIDGMEPMQIIKGGFFQNDFSNGDIIEDYDVICKATSI